MKLGFGLMRLPITDGDRTKIDMETFTGMADEFIKAGGTYFDTAWPYHGGFSESAFREAVVKRYPRESFTVTDKMPIFLINEESELSTYFDTQLERCGVDRFDYYLLHALDDDSSVKAEKLHAFEFVLEKKNEGKIGHIGFSFHGSPEALDRILSDHPEFEYVQLQLNYIDWDDPLVRARECFETAMRHGRKIIIMEPVKGGALASIPEDAEKLLREKEPDMSAASWALRYAASLDGVEFVLSGMSSPEQVTDNVGVMADFKALDETDKKTLEGAIAILRSLTTIPCTECRYCMNDWECPADIPITDYFSIYNNRKRFAIPRSVSYTKYRELASEHGKASDCIECGGCEDHCPQHLDIRALLREVASEMER